MDRTHFKGSFIRTGARHTTSGVDAMKILLDITRLLRRSGQMTPTGIDRVELAYAKHLIAHYPDSSTFVGRFRSRVWQLNPSAVPYFVNTLAARWDLSNALVTRNELRRLEEFLNLRRGAMAHPPGPHVPRKEMPEILSALPSLLSPINILPGLFRRPIAKGAVYLNVSHEGLNSPGRIERLVRTFDWKPIYLVHDLIPVTHPEYVRPGDEAKHTQRMKTVLNSASAVIYNSAHTERMMNSFAMSTDMKPARGIVSLLGVEEKFQKGQERAADLPPVGGDPYFVVVGTIEPRKNHLLLLNLWRHLVERHGAKAPKLVIVGRRGWENENIIDVIDRCSNLKQHLIECNRLPDWQLTRLLSGARAVLFPSFAEGYGLPLAEALSLRVPVICSNLEVFQDIAGNIPYYLDPIDGMSWLKVIEDFALPDSSLRQAQMAKIDRFAAPTWQQHFDAVDELIADVAQPRPAPHQQLLSTIRRKISLRPAGEHSLEAAGAEDLIGARLPHSTTI